MVQWNDNPLMAGSRWLGNGLCDGGREQNLGQRANDALEVGVKELRPFLERFQL